MLVAHNLNDSGAEDSIRSMMGPTSVDHMVRQALQHCWMMLPPDTRSVEAVETQMRHLLDRAIRDMKEDAQAFGPS